MRRRPFAKATAALLVAVLSAFVLGAGDGSGSHARLTLDATAFHPELALTPSARSQGLMNRKRAPVDGMLFVFKHPTSSAFWMKNTLVPLKIVFFNAGGERVRRLTMTPCRTETCPVYDPMRIYRFALELPVGDTRPARRLGPIGELRRLIRQSS